MIARIVFACVAVFTFFLAAPALSVAESGEEMQVVSNAQLRLVGGNGNGLCCVVEGGSLCANLPGSGGCAGILPSECSCVNPGGVCILVEKFPKNNDVCATADVNPEDANCNLNDTYCYTVKDGICNDDGGPWSWFYLCTTCGCVLDGDPERAQGARFVCDSSSTNC